MIPDTVLQSDLLTPAEKLLFPQLVVLCGSTGMTKADNDELQAALGISERSCSALITNLNRAGFISVTVDRKLKKNQRTIRLKELTQDFALSPVLLQKLMLADADSCVKLAQILASALPDADSCVKLAQILASATKEQCADSESFTKADADFCVNPGQNSVFSDNRDNNIYNNILTTTQISNSNITTKSYSVEKPETADLTQESAAPADRSTPFITLDGQRIKPQQLGQILSLRGIADDQVAPFVTEHSGRTYNDLKELKDLARKWLRRTTPKPPKKSLEERRQDFKDELSKYNRLNPGKYPVDFYKEFFEYYSLTSNAGTTMRFEKDNYFFSSLSNKLAYSYKHIYLKNQTHANSNNRSGNGKQLAFVTASDLGDDTTHADARSAYPRSEPDDEATGSYTATVLVSME